MIKTCSFESELLSLTTKMNRLLKYFQGHSKNTSQSHICLKSKQHCLKYFSVSNYAKSLAKSLYLQVALVRRYGGKKVF